MARFGAKRAIDRPRRGRDPKTEGKLTVGLEGGRGLEAGRPHRVLLLVPVLHVADGEADRRQGVAARERRPDRVLLLEGEPLLGVLVLVDRGDAALELGDAAGVEGHLVRGDRGEVGAGQPRGIVPDAVGDLVALVAVLAADLLPGGGRRRRRPRGELGDGVAVVQLRVAGDVVVARVAALRRVLDRQDVEVRAAVVLGVPGARAVRLRGGRPRVLEAVRLLQLLRRLQHQVDAVGALVIHAAAAHRLREVHDHRPRHPGQVAQITLRPFAHHLAGEERRVGLEELLLLDNGDGGEGGEGGGGSDRSTYHFTSTVWLAHDISPRALISLAVSELSSRLIVCFVYYSLSLSSSHGSPLFLSLRSTKRELIPSAHRTTRPRNNRRSK